MPCVGRAAPEPQQPVPELRAVEAAFKRGFEQFERGGFSSAAQSWGEVARLMPMTPEQRANHRALLEKIADAWIRQLVRASGDDLAREIVVTLDTHMQRFVAAYPDEPEITAVAEALRAARARIEAVEAADAANGTLLPIKLTPAGERAMAKAQAKRAMDASKGAPPLIKLTPAGERAMANAQANGEADAAKSAPPLSKLTATGERAQAQAQVQELERAQALERARALERAQGPRAALKKRPSRPWKGLAIAGGVTLAGGAAMLAMFGASKVQVRDLQRRFDDPANECVLGLRVAECAEIYRDGKAADAASVVGLVLAPVLFGAGVTMIAIATRRRAAPPRIAPILSPHSVGLTWERRF